jgi:hypothetical protein
VDPRAEAVFERFRVHPGAIAIATPCALAGVIRTIERYQPRRILEIGTGIGTMTAAILVATPAGGGEIVTVEDNEYCRNELITTLGGDLKRLRLVRSTDQVVGQFDLVVVDGDQLPDIVHTVAARGLVLVEGARAPQRDALAVAGRPYCVEHIRTVRLMASDDPWLHTPVERYQGGYYLFRFEPTRKDRARFAVRDWWDNRVIGWRRRARRVLGLERR